MAALYLLKQKQSTRTDLSERAPEAGAVIDLRGDQIRTLLSCITPLVTMIPPVTRSAVLWFAFSEVLFHFYLPQVTRST